mmetsp:Transcript_443/g.1501  ORF Transcript_443/g.1501 Transcript_443/m.1501 type:complete len:244 (-) Transcript_443:239-970(-)
MVASLLAPGATRGQSPGNDVNGVSPAASAAAPPLGGDTCGGDTCSAAPCTCCSAPGDAARAAAASAASASPLPLLPPPLLLPPSPLPPLPLPSAAATAPPAPPVQQYHPVVPVSASLRASGTTLPTIPAAAACCAAGCAGGHAASCAAGGCAGFFAGDATGAPLPHHHRHRPRRDPRRAARRQPRRPDGAAVRGGDAPLAAARRRWLDAPSARRAGRLNRTRDGRPLPVAAARGRVAASAAAE